MAAGLPGVRQRAWRLLAAAAFMAGWACGAPAQALEEVPFVTTPDQVTEAMLKLAGVGASDFVLDLGSGDGRIVITAARRFGARGLGVEIVPDLVQRSRDYARRAGVEARAEFREQDLFRTDLSVATVITMYLLPEVNMQLRPALLKLRPGTRIVSHDWGLGDWHPVRTIEVEAPQKTVGREKLSRVHLWIVPAPAEGVWCGAGRWLRLDRTHDRVDGVVATGSTALGSVGLLQGESMTLHGHPGTFATMRASVRDDELRVEAASGAWVSWNRAVLRRVRGERCPG